MRLATITMTRFALRAMLQLHGLGLRFDVF
jgi:hypothetical protein